MAKHYLIDISDAAERLDFRQLLKFEMSCCKLVSRIDPDAKVYFVDECQQSEFIQINLMDENEEIGKVAELNEAYDGDFMQAVWDDANIQEVA